jgi:cytochrome oxidase assembly protein ShyY1
MLVTSEGTDLPYVLFWAGLALALIAGAFYVASALRRPA